jgi:hypothetical protein
MATCHVDNEPLVGTLKFRGYEFICVVCERKYEFLSPKAAVETPELRARYEELRARWRGQQEAEATA